MHSKDHKEEKQRDFLRYKYLFGFALLAVLIIGLSGCAESPGFAEAALREKVGFWHGLWHGFISPISFFISLLDADVSMYAIYNNGGWYDFGFVLGAGILFGGSQHT